MVTSDLLLPFGELITMPVNWTGCVISLHEDQLWHMPHFLRNLSFNHWLERRKECLAIYHQLFAIRREEKYAKFFNIFWNEYRERIRRTALVQTHAPQPLAGRFESHRPAHAERRAAPILRWRVDTSASHAEDFKTASPRLDDGIWPIGPVESFQGLSIAVLLCGGLFWMILRKWRRTALRRPASRVSD